MIDDLAGFDVSFQSLTLSGIGILCLILVLTGRLVPRSRVDSELRAKDKTIDMLSTQNSSLLQTLGATDKLLGVMTEKATQQEESDGTT